MPISVLTAACRWATIGNGGAGTLSLQADDQAGRRARLLDDHEIALTTDLPESLQEAWERVRETAASFGDQRIYASHKSIMFSRNSCYFFVRPKRNVLELCVFLGRTVKAPQVRRVDQASKSKIVHIIHIRHRDEVEAPIADWLGEAYVLSKKRP